jgi:hypothetical protein
LLVWPCDENPFALETAEAVSQDVRGDAGQAVLHFTEPPRSVEQRLDDEQTPAVADPVERDLER